MLIQITKKQFLTIIYTSLFLSVLISGMVVTGDVLACQCCEEDNYENCTYIECECDSDCGSSTFIGPRFCQDGDVYRDYRTVTCLNPGTAEAECTSSNSPVLWFSCESWEICQNGCCVDDCISHSYKQCSGDNLYWYDSCGNRENVAQYCEDGCYNDQCQDYFDIAIQTNSATKVHGNQAILNGRVHNIHSNCSTYVWFEYGPTTSYGYQTTRQYKGHSGNFSKVINLYDSYNTYHFRAVAQDCRGNTVYGQDRIIYNQTTGFVNVSKTVRNLTTGTGFASSVSASPSDMLMFMITLQTSGSQTVNNVYVRDSLPNNLIYKNQLVVSGASYSGDITSGINLSTIPRNQTVTITYQAQLAPTENFSYGTTTLNNNVNVTGSNLNYNPTSNASVFVAKSGVYGASTISTGLTNNFWLDSFFLPLVLVLFGIWMWRSGMFFGMERWLDNKKKNRRIYTAEKELNKRVATIQKVEN